MREQSVSPAVVAAAIRDYLTTDEVAERYRRSPATVRYWRHIKYGPRGVRNGRIVLYPRGEIERFDRELAAAAAAGEPMSA